MTLTTLADQKREEDTCYMFVFKNIQHLPPSAWDAHEDFVTSPTWRVTVVSWNIPISTVMLTNKPVVAAASKIMTTYLLKKKWKVLLGGLSSGHPNKIDLLLGEVPSP